jgi:transcriptional regulator with XRE-family HTH domain
MTAEASVRAPHDLDVRLLVTHRIRHVEIAQKESEHTSSRRMTFDRRGSRRRPPQTMCRRPSGPTRGAPRPGRSSQVPFSATVAGMRTTPNTALRAARTARLMSQDDLARALREAGCASATKRLVQRWESGTTTHPRPSHAQALERVMKLPIESLGFGAVRMGRGIGGVGALGERDGFDLGRQCGHRYVVRADRF